MGNESLHKRTFFPEAFFLGFSMIGSQIILVREFLMIFFGNELVIGLLFAIWMLLTAFGAWLGRLFKDPRYLTAILRILLIIVCVYPILAAFGMEYYRNDIFEMGRMIAPMEMVLGSLLILAPHCLAGGLAFSLINISSSEERGALQSCYAYESLGSLSGGLFVSIVFIYYLGLDNLVGLQYLALAGMIYFGITDYRLRKFFQSFTYLLAAIGFMHLIYNYDLNTLAKESLFRNQELIFAKETPFGNLAVTKMNGQFNIYENGIICSTSDETILREEGIHYGLSQVPNPRSVLLIGGYATGMANEVMKYPGIEQLVLLEANADIFGLDDILQEKYTDQRIETAAMDPIVYVNSSDQIFDAILINQPPPSNVQINRYYTVEFFAKLKGILNEDGIISTSLSASSNYLSDEELLLHSSLFRSLSLVFDEVVTIAGTKNYFLASDLEIDWNFVEKLSAKGIANEYIGGNYLDEDLLQLRSRQLMETFYSNSAINRDFKPLAYKIYAQQWMGKFGLSLWLILGAGIVISLVFIVLSKPAVSSMFVSGFSGAAAEIAILIAFQVIFGYTYLFIGIIITAFMGGLAVGSYFSKQCKMKNWYNMLMFIQLFSAIYLIVVALKISLLKETDGVFLVQSTFILMTLAVSFLVGLQYGASVCRSRDSVGLTIAQVYSADLIGAAFGSLLAVIWLIPVFGLLTTLVILGSLHLLNIILVSGKRKMNYF